MLLNPTIVSDVARLHLDFLLCDDSLHHPIHNCCLGLFFTEKDCVYLDAERLYDHIKWETFQTRALTPPPRQTRVTRAHKRYCVRSTHSSNTAQRCRRAL